MPENSKKIHVFTSAAYNYLPKVRVLFNSIRKTHPNWRLHLLLVDDNKSLIDIELEDFDEVHSIDELDIPNFKSWIFKHSIVELATAVKPFLLVKLLERQDCDAVIYFDPDISIFSSLEELIQVFANNSIVLTPHLTEQDFGLDAILDNEISCLKHGTYNLGFIGVKADSNGLKFGHWWRDRLYHFCYDDIPSGLFTDQKWIDLVPALFEGVEILRSPQYNVAPWNIANRILEIDVFGRYLVNSMPMSFYHFTGFDSGAHKIMAVKNSRANPNVIKIIEWYSSELDKYKVQKRGWGYDSYSNGVKISREQRLIYRSRNDLQITFPDPFLSSSFLEWWESQGKIEYPDYFYQNLSDPVEIKENRKSRITYKKIIEKLLFLFKYKITIILNRIK